LRRRAGIASLPASPSTARSPENPVSDTAVSDIPEGALLLTGATGFVGMEVLARFLERSDDHVVALVRAEDDDQAAARLRATLEGACLDAGAHEDRVTALAGDLTAPRLGLGDRWGQLAERVGAIVHGAASVAFDLSLEESRRINVDGTRRMLELAHACPRLRRFTYVSTAYVAGDRRGTVYEDDPGGGRFRNAYERTKHEAERLVAACRDDMEVTIVRPSIVVGDHRTGWTAAFNVLYAPLRAFEAGVVPVVPARRRSPVDVVPVDYVADAVHALAEAPEAAGQTFHVVAGERASTVGEIVDMAGERFTSRQPRIVPPWLYHAIVERIVEKRAPASARRLLASNEVYFSYFAMRVRYDDARARAILEPRGITAAPLSAYFGRLMDYAQAARWGRRAVARPRAGRVRATI
jgi:thioester reductase-like protein